MNAIDELAVSLQPIVEFELARDNRVARIDKPAGTKCPLAVIFTLPLDMAGFRMAQGLPAHVKTWENRDPHYSLEAGYVCEVTRHALAGPAGGAL
jgi:hypothetical protein